MGDAECDTLDMKTAEILDPGLVAAVRTEEMRHVAWACLETRDEECRVEGGKQGNASGSSDSLPLGRPRLEAEGRVCKGRLPPLEAKKVLLSTAASNP